MNDYLVHHIGLANPRTAQETVRFVRRRPPTLRAHPSTRSGPVTRRLQTLQRTPHDLALAAEAEMISNHRSALCGALLVRRVGAANPRR